MNFKNHIGWRTLKETVKKFFEENPFQHSAAIAYFTIFSLPGIAIITVVVAGSFYAQDTVREELITQITFLMGKSSANQVQELMTQSFISGDSWVMKTVGVITLLVSATTVFISLQDSLNSIWKVKPKQNKAIFKFFIKRLLSLAMVASVGFLILVSLMADTLVAILKYSIEYYISGFSYYIILAINTTVSLVVITFIFALIFKVLPDADIKWKHVRVGAVVTTVLFVIGKYAIGYYLNTSDLASTYGAAGSLVALLAWVYYSVLILLFGAQFTYIYSNLTGEKILANEGAVNIEIEEVER